MSSLKRLFALALTASQILVSYGFLSDQQKSPLHLHCSSRIQKPNSAGVAIDAKFKRPAFQYSEMSSMVRHRRSVATVQVMGLFGLGGAEIAIIMAAGAFIIGPQQLGNMVGSVTGKVKDDLPDELRKIPQEFQKGFEESTENSRARNAKLMESPPDENGRKK